MVMLMAMAACSQPAADVNSAADINSTEDTTSAGKEDTKDISGEPEEIVVKKTEYGTKEVVLEGKNLDELTVTGTDNPYYCNLEENLKMPFSADDIPIYVCKNPVYDIAYYVNYGRDNYIYAYRNGTSELAVEIPARDLFCKEGELYFIAETDGQYQFSGFTEGNILKYNPMDGSVSVVVNCNAKKMRDYPECICYKAVGERMATDAEGTPTEETVISSFATGESSTWPENADSLRRWNGYWLQNVEEMRELLESDPTWQNPEIQAALAKGYTVSVGTGKIGELKLLDAQGNEVETLQNVAGIPNDFFIIGDF